MSVQTPSAYTSLQSRCQRATIKDAIKRNSFITQHQHGHLDSDETHMFSLSKDNPNILNSCRMLHMEHDNTQNEDLQGNGKDEVRKS